VTAPDPLNGVPPLLLARLLGYAADSMIRHGEHAVVPGVSAFLQREGWPEANARRLADRIAAEVAAMPHNQMLEHFRAHGEIDTAARQAAQITGPEAEITERQRRIRALREAARREDKREDEATAEVTPASKIVKKRARWLWDCGDFCPQIPLGELTIAAGREGAAKTQWTYWAAARVTRGTLPGELHGQPRNVIICAREDDWSKTIVPRLEAAGADLDKVFRVQAVRVASGRTAHLSLPADNDLLEKAVTDLDAALVIFDPLLSVLDGKLNAHKASDVRAALEPLAEIAHRTGAAMTGLAHFAKMEGRDAASLISGSHAFKDVARAVLVFARDSETTGVMSQPKNNLGRLPSLSLEYRVEAVQIEAEDGQAEAPRFVMGGPTARSVEDLLDTGRARAVAEAKDFLRDELSKGERLSKDITDAARQHGIAIRTLDRARKELSITPRKHADGTWWMELPGGYGSDGVHGGYGGYGSLSSSGGYPPSLPSSSSPSRPPRPPNYSPARAREEPPQPDFQRLADLADPAVGEDE
jgi:hypothetical protein